MKRILALILCLLSAPVLAQTGTAVKQSGFVTPGHISMWSTNGIIQDGGTAAIGFLTSLGVTASGPAICQNSGQVSGPYNQICLGVTQTGGGLLSLIGYSGASGGLKLDVNGVTGNAVSSVGTFTNGDCLSNNNGQVIDAGGPCTTGGGGGTVTSGTANQIAYYPTTGATVAGSNALPNGTTATTQSTGDNSTKVATDAFVLANGPVNAAAQYTIPYYSASGTASTLSGSSLSTDSSGDLILANPQYITWGAGGGDHLLMGPGTGNFLWGCDQATGITSPANNNVCINGGAYGFHDFTTGDGNVAIQEAAKHITSGGQNICIGASTCWSVSTARYNIAIGRGMASEASYSTNTGASNVAIGNALTNDTSGSNNTAINDGGAAITTGNNNIAIGLQAIGTGAGVTGSDNIALGHQALQSITGVADGNIGIGPASGASLTTGVNNTFIGFEAGINHTTSDSYNTEIGGYGGKAGDTGVIVFSTGDGTVWADYNHTNTNVWTDKAPRVPKVYTVAILPGSPASGSEAMVSDASSSCTFGATPTGGGSNYCPVFYNGAAWVEY